MKESLFIAMLHPHRRVRQGLSHGHTARHSRTVRITAAAICAVIALPALGQSAPPALDLPVSPQVTQRNIARTICRIGWTRQVRPSYAFTHAMKLRKLRAKHLPPSAAADFELDHLIPLDLGGDPYNLNNLALEPWGEAHEKDAVEGCLASEVCAGAISLAAAQQAIWQDWRGAGRLCTR